MSLCLSRFSSFYLGFSLSCSFAFFHSSHPNFLSEVHFVSLSISLFLSYILIISLTLSPSSPFFILFHHLLCLFLLSVVLALFPVSFSSYRSVTVSVSLSFFLSLRLSIFLSRLCLGPNSVSPFLAFYPSSSHLPPFLPSILLCLFYPFLTFYPSLFLFLFLSLVPHSPPPSTHGGAKSIF